MCRNIIAGPPFLLPSDSAISSGAIRPDLLWDCKMVHINCDHNCVFKLFVFFYIPCLHCLFSIYHRLFLLMPLIFSLSTLLLQCCDFSHCGTNIEISYGQSKQQFQILTTWRAAVLGSINLNSVQEIGPLRTYVLIPMFLKNSPYYPLAPEAESHHMGSVAEISP